MSSLCAFYPKMRTGGRHFEVDKKKRTTKEEICREWTTDFARTETCSTHKKILQNLPKKLASNDAEDLLCSLFLYFLSFFFFLLCVCVCCAFLKTSLFLTVVHPHSLCSWEDGWLCWGCHYIFKNLHSVGRMFLLLTDGNEREKDFCICSK